MSEKADQAVRTMIKRIRDDGRLAYLIGPGSRAYEELTEAYAEATGEDPDTFRRQFERVIKPQRVDPLANG